MSRDEADGSLSVAVGVGVAVVAVGAVATAVALAGGSAKEEGPMTSASLLWPLPFARITRIGDTVMPDRNGRPHHGVDLFAPAGTPVLAPADATVIRVVDGRGSKVEAMERAGLWVDLRGSDGTIYRLLHLDAAAVSAGQAVQAGDPLAVIAPAHTSGLGKDPHLHFEIRATDWDRRRRSYGDATDPVKLLRGRLRIA